MIPTHEFIEWLEKQMAEFHHDINVGEQVFKVEWTAYSANRHNQVYFKVFFFEVDEAGQKFMRDGELATDMRIVQMRDTPT